MEQVGTIVKVTRSSIIVQYGDKTISVPGEAYLPGYGSPDFVASLSALKTWDKPHHEDFITDEARQQIKLDIQSGMAKRQMSVEFE